ncbi:MAG: bifunctional hydroxymethylpyrimidine kinase/phosphomethylpyrimidine kinase [Proteobacteria bacterium]|nr:bifunctional hydroxymethylpyrimidine kinase/phosphomethylpyrimidine kinase [Pseudomonadota bacterium]
MNGRILIIAGSDSGGGAGIQADLKTVMALGGYGATAITAITIQNTRGVQGIFPIPPEVVTRQIEAVLEDIGADAIKTGMLHDAAMIDTVASLLQTKDPKIPLVVDPVMVAKGGHALLQENAVSILKKELIPLATVITPNISEAEKLLSLKINSTDEMPEAAHALSAFGAKAVLLKGGHLPGNEIVDVLWNKKELTLWKSPRIPSTSTHGTGCTLASAIATGLAQGMPLKEAVERAREYVQGAIRHAVKLGQGHGPMNHGWKNIQANE